MTSVNLDQDLDVAAQYRSWIRAIESYDRGHDPGGSAGGPIGASGLETAKAIANHAENGAVHVPIAVLASSIGRSRQTVSHAIRRLQNAGFLHYRPGSRAAPAVLEPIDRP